MITSSETQLKDIVKNKAKENKIPVNAFLQCYLLECLLDRIAHSPYKNKFIIKGGLLVSSLAGITARTTMDMDATITSLPLDADIIKKVFSEICAIPVDDDFTFEVSHTEQIREMDEYKGIRLFLFADYVRMHLPVSVDITAGDAITPRATVRRFSRLLDNKTISCKVYPLETLLAEKIETILSRNIGNTRSRDYYDVYTLTKLYTNTINLSLLKQALKRTASHRGSEEILPSYEEIIVAIKANASQKVNWVRYQKKFPYADGVSFEAVCDVLLKLVESIYEEK